MKKSTTKATSQKGMKYDISNLSEQERDIKLDIIINQAKRKRARMAARRKTIAIVLTTIMMIFISIILGLGIGYIVGSRVITFCDYLLYSSPIVLIVFCPIIMGYEYIVKEIKK